MADTTNLSEGARLLGLSQRTVRKKLSQSYKGADRIKGAKKVGRDWHIPRSEIRRLVDLKAKILDRSTDGQEAFTIAFEISEELTDAAFARLVAACHAFADTAYSRKDTSKERAELRRAFRNWEGLTAAADTIVDAIANRVTDRDWLAQIGYLDETNGADRADWAADE